MSAVAFDAVTAVDVRARCFGTGGVQLLSWAYRGGDAPAGGFHVVDSAPSATSSPAELSWSSTSSTQAQAHVSGRELRSSVQCRPLDDSGLDPTVSLDYIEVRVSYTLAP